MVCHIKIGSMGWCCFPQAPEFRELCARSSVATTCEHGKAADAVALVHLLQDHGVEAVIVEGRCEWNPADPDLRLFAKRFARVEYVRESEA